jgi:sugar O-acyltransferase (sialic acid O-acetyltransferase NeuD family)
MPADVIVLGAGGHARVVIDALRRAGFAVAGVCAPELSAGQPGPLGAPALGGDGALDGVDRARYLLANGIGSIGAPAVRQKVFETRKADGWRFVTLVHPAAVVGEDCALGEGAQVMAGAVLQPGVRLGRNTIVNTRAAVDHDCRLGDHVHVAPGVVLSGGVTVGSRSHLGTGAVVIQDIAIGDDVLVGAGAVVIRPVADGTRVKAGALHGAGAESQHG